MVIDEDKANMDLVKEFLPNNPFMDSSLVSSLECVLIQEKTISPEILIYFFINSDRNLNTNSNAFSKTNPKPNANPNPNLNL